MLSLGITVETLHGFKAGLYLDVSNQTRRLMWTLAHAHGTLLSVLNLVFATSIQRLPEWNGTARTLASRCLLGALVRYAPRLLAASTAGAAIPNSESCSFPPGALLLFLGVLLTAKGYSSARVDDPSDDPVNRRVCGVTFGSPYSFDAPP